MVMSSTIHRENVATEVEDKDEDEGGSITIIDRDSVIRTVVMMMNMDRNESITNMINTEIPESNIPETATIKKSTENSTMIMIVAMIVTIVGITEMNVITSIVTGRSTFIHQMKSNAIP